MIRHHTLTLSIFKNGVSMWSIFQMQYQPNRAQLHCSNLSLTYLKHHRLRYFTYVCLSNCSSNFLFVKYCTRWMQTWDLIDFVYLFPQFQCPKTTELVRPPVPVIFCAQKKVMNRTLVGLSFILDLGSSSSSAQKRRKESYEKSGLFLGWVYGLESK